MTFGVNTIVSVDQVGNGLAIETPVPVQLRYHNGKWQARCESPTLVTQDHDSMEGALITGAGQIAAEVQAAVIERPMILAKITPDSIPTGMF